MLGFLLWFSLSFGLQDACTQYTISEPIFTEIELHAESDYIDIYGIYKNEMYKGDGLWFHPQQDYYTVGIKANFNQFSVTTEHMCQHPVMCYGDKSHGIYGGYTKVYATFSSKK